MTYSSHKRLASKLALLLLVDLELSLCHLSFCLGGALLGTFQDDSYVNPHYYLYVIPLNMVFMQTSQQPSKSGIIMCH